MSARLLSDMLQFLAENSEPNKKVIYSAGLLVFKPKIPLEVLLIAYRHPMYKQLFIVEFPKGTIEAGEKPIEAAQREVEEETGLPIEDITILRQYKPLRMEYNDAYNRHKQVIIFPAICKKCKVLPKTIEADYVFWASIDIALYLLTKEPMREYLVKIAPRIYKDILRIDKEDLVLRIIKG